MLTDYPLPQTALGLCHIRALYPKRSTEYLHELVNVLRGQSALFSEQLFRRRTRLKKRIQQIRLSLQEERDDGENNEDYDKPLCDIHTESSDPLSTEYRRDDREYQKEDRKLDEASPEL